MTRSKASQRPAWTPLGGDWWDWQPLAEAAPTTRLFWLALYSSHQAKRCLPGLWHGGLAVMADVARLELAQVEGALSELLELRLVEHDPVAKVARLVELPDRLDRPNGDQIIGWWGRWRKIPQCTVRDSHVETLRWLCGDFTQYGQQCWDETFATVPRPLRVPLAVAPNGHRDPHGGGHRRGHGEGQGVRGSYGGDIVGRGQGVPDGVGHSPGEGEVISSLLPDSGSHRSSREISNSPGSSVIEDPTVAAEVDASWESWERRCGDPVDLAHESVRRYGPRAAVQDGPSASSERFK